MADSFIGLAKHFVFFPPSILRVSVLFICLPDSSKSIRRSYGNKVSGKVESSSKQKKKRLSLSFSTILFLLPKVAKVYNPNEV